MKRIIISLPNKKQVNLKFEGKIEFEEMLDMFNTAMYDILTHIAEKQPEMKKPIYERAVMGFSLMIDKFYPEGVKTKFHGLTDEAILRAQNEIIKDEIHKRKQKQTKVS